MGLSDLLGQENARRQMAGVLSSGKLAPSYLFYGPEGVGQVEFAYAFLKGIFCPHADGDFCGDCDVCRRIEHRTFPDVNWIELREEKGKSRANVIEVDQVREDLVEQAMMAPMEAERKLFVVHPAEALSVPAGNCLLKVLEEPPSFSHVLLLCGNVNRLLPTLYSRCQRIRFVPVPTALIERSLLASGTDPASARLAAEISAGRPEIARRLAERNLEEEALQLLREVYKGATGDGAAALGVAAAMGKERSDALEGLALLRTLLFHALRAAETGECPPGSLQKGLTTVAQAVGAPRLHAALDASLAAEEALRNYANVTLSLDTVLGELVRTPAKHAAS